MRPVALLVALTALGCTTSFEPASLPTRDAGADLANDLPGPDVRDAPTPADLPDATSCGAAGAPCCDAAAVRCEAGSICNEGLCVACPGATVACAGGCVDPQTSLGHCGRCGNACASGESCVGGSCTLVCPAGLNACDGRCVDLARSGSHCGACATSCALGALCQGGSCVVSCAPGESVCAGACVDTATSASHCGACGARCAPPNAAPRCQGGVCAIASCADGFGDCDGSAANGCETDLRSPTNCGRCGAVCEPSNATPSCSAGVCAVAGCTPGFGDCDGSAANGCEVDLSRDVRNCGGCGTVCPTAPPGRVAVCIDRACTTVTANCATGRAECGGASSSDCETDITTVRDCGRCGNACAIPNATNTCENGRCHLSSCAAGFENCDGDAANGCEVDVRTSAANCGGCRRACALPNANARCDAGACAVLSCAQGFADCDQNPTNGCEVDLRTSSTSCGACGARCQAANGAAACVGGQCVLSACAAGFADCDGNLANGCETRTSADAANCGACRNACVLPNATPRCAGGACQVDGCASGFQNCDGDAANGCEVDLRTSSQHCGACNRPCVVANGTGACDGGSCRIASCAAGYADCDNDPENGCETSTTTAQNCGRCGAVCPTNSVCSAGACASACAPGLTFCAGACVATQSDPQHCGSCTTVCPARANAAATCAAGACGYACTAGFGDCDGDASNGCEARLDSRENCGGCGARCSNPPNAQAFCNGGTCSYACDSRHADCDGDASNGCEVDVLADPNNCGRCLTRCPRPANAQPVCREGHCTFSCNAGRGDCDESPVNGCETDLVNTSTSCGSCGTTCLSGQCRGGVCSLCLSSDATTVDCDWSTIGGLRCRIDLSNDPMNCGACGQVCPSGARPALHASFTGVCVNSRCVLNCQAGWGNCDGSWQNGCEVNTTCDVQHCGGCSNVGAGQGTACLGNNVCCGGECVLRGRHTCQLSAPGCR
ncbi:MAG: hypothetical protein R3A48_16995 [Polyangiales bacterium]